MPLTSSMMLKLRIDNKEIKVREGTRLIDAARDHGINIPSLCYKKELPHYTSCMVCIVKDNQTGKFIPSCSARVEEGMDIDASGPEVIALRRDAISLLLTEHRAECEAPCKLVCPVGLNIPLMNRYLQECDFLKASQLIFFEMGMPESLCTVCPEYCENACRRKMIDEPVAITSIKHFTTASAGPPPMTRQIEKPAKVAIIGAGASGLTAAFNLAKNGHTCVVFEKSKKIGGTLRSELSAKGSRADLLDNELNFLIASGVEIRLNAAIDIGGLEKDLIPEYDIVINASGTNIKSDKLQAMDSTIQFEGDTWKIGDTYLFHVGSAVKQDKQVIRRIGNAKRSAGAINHFLQSGKLIKVRKRFNSVIGKIEEDEKAEWLKECPEETKRYSDPGNKKECVEEALNCLHCDCREADSCQLRELAESLDVSNPRMKLASHTIEKKINHKNKLIYEHAKCIKCGLCVRVSQDRTNNPSLCFTGRGFVSKVTEPLTADFDSILPDGTDRVINICPTGALTKKET